jgi:hypothetical protein
MNRLDKVILWFLVGFFAFSALDKLLHIEGFVVAIQSYRLVPVFLGRLLASVVVAAELAIAVGLAVPAFRTLAASLEIGFIVVVSLAAVLQQVMGGANACGCWFSINMARGPLHWVLNLILLILGLFVLRAWRVSTRADGFIERGRAGTS